MTTLAKHEHFNMKNREQFFKKCAQLGVSIPYSENMEVYHNSVKIGHVEAPNALAVLPMEGCDSNADGSPSDLVRRRYERFFLGGAGLIWWEANAVVEEGKANELQMMLNKQNKGAFSDLISNLKTVTVKKYNHTPVSILQLTHSGRYSRPRGDRGIPIIAQHDPILDKRMGIDSDYPLCTDEYLKDLVGSYVESALLAQEVGFDGVDVKACHRYLLSELLASHTRGGEYGGTFENRVRLLLEIIRSIKTACGEHFIVACRFNIFDAHPYPYGFGCAKDDMWVFDEEEPIKLVEALVESGVSLLSNSAGNPYYIYPQVTRPFDLSSEGIPVPDEHPLESIERLFSFTELIQRHSKGIPVVGNGYTWLRQFIAPVGSANLQKGACAFVGLGRSSFAYPDAPREILQKGGLDPKKCCVSCSKCTQIMRDHGRTGCVIRDNKVYAPLYMEARQKAEKRRSE